MKKSLLTALVMAAACYGVSNAEIVITATNVPQPVNDTLLFALPVNPESVQEIWTAYDYVNPATGATTSMINGKFQPEYLVTALDFSNGDTEKGTPTLPNNAKVIGLGLDGFDIGSERMPGGGVYHRVTAWCRNIPADKMELDYLDLFDGYKIHDPEGDLFTDTVNWQNASGTQPGVLCQFDLDATLENPAPIVDIPFGNPDDPFMPFWYQGENIYLTLWLINPGTRMKYCYMAYDEAEAEYASLFRSGNVCFNSESQDAIKDVFGIDMMYELPRHRLPAFRTPYYTNDVRVTKVGYDTEFQLRDEDGNVMTPNEEGNFLSLDHTKVYSLWVGNETLGYKNKYSFTFDDIYQDIHLVIDNKTAVEEINANKAVAGVAYYNLAGQQSAQPVNGVNIVVTTYTDGSTTTAKVIK